MSERKTPKKILSMKKNPLQNNSHSQLELNSINSLIHTAKVQLATKLNSVKNSPKGISKKEQSVSFYEGASQSEIPVKDIIDGIVITEDNRYVGILEVFPINYDKKTHVEKKLIVNNFIELFVNGPVKMSIKVLSDTSNPIQLIRNIKKNCKNQDNPLIKKALSDYISFIQQIGNTNSVVKRFFVIYEYSQESTEKKAADRNSIIETMLETRFYIKDVLNDCGNICYAPENENLFTSEIIYTYFNRKTSRQETFEQRYTRIYQDFETFNTVTGKEKEISYADLFAPKGLYFTSRDSIFMDGYYYGYIGIDGDSWPQKVYWTWNQKILDFGPYVDVDYIFKRPSQQLIRLGLKQMNNITQSTTKEFFKRGFNDLANKSQRKLKNNNDVYQAMNAGDTLSNCAIILTIRASTEKELGSMKRLIKKQLNKNGIKTDNSRLHCEEYFKITMPFLYLTPVYSRLKHDILASAIRSMYPFISYQIYNPKGYVLGSNKDNNSLVVIDNFNTELYKNANMLLLGTSGSGKTYTEELIARRMHLNGIRCFFIIPKKGYEYRNGCEALDGTFITLRPGSSDCVNIMEIRPEGEIDRQMVSDDAIVQKSSLLAKKVTSLIVWLQLLLSTRTMTPREYNKLNRIIIDIYYKHGITENNMSIYQEGSDVLKIMPTLGELHKAMIEVPELSDVCDVLEPFVFGSCKNMDGQTNVNLKNNYVVFDIDEDDIGENLLAPFLYIGFDYVYSVVKEDTLSKDAIFLDEVWKLMACPDSAKQVKNMIKLVRGYGGSAILATQELEDFLKSDDEFGKSVLNNTEITILLNLKELGLGLVKDSLRLEEEDCNAIRKFKRGSCMLISNGDKILVDIKSTQQEFHAFNTDINKRIGA